MQHHGVDVDPSRYLTWLLLGLVLANENIDIEQGEREPRDLQTRQRAQLDEGQ